ncbi:CU044_5270 family protein [Amycolatopsis alba]|uniref:CU044_5270 family protein n=1 Tax=Amycolatopsis alba DSM 44262 TaxID=1125972 RepID=A0A229RYS8_AMYAL|nr:CU044_5270 family protein [Amycolatopsis alba]OXM51639.1 hypothetical protein CFP75_12745 [Amycolatopsis alba DSM 44262]
MHGDSIRKVWSEAELDEALAELHAEPETRQDELSRARASLLRAAGEAEGEILPVTAPPPAKKRQGAWRWIAAAAAAALVSGGGIVATNVFTGTGGQDPAAPATAATGDDVLKDLRGADLPLAGNQYWLSTESTWTTRIGSKSGVIYQTHEIQERWLPSDWSVRHRTRLARTGEVRWIKGDQEAARSAGDMIPGRTVDTGWEGPPPPTGGPVSGEHTTSAPMAPPRSATTTSEPPEAPVSTQGPKPPRISWTTPTKELLDSLPTDPAKLLERLRGDNGDDEAETAPKMFDKVYSIMRSSHGYGELRVALCKALATTPGITLETNVTTSDRRPAISFSVRKKDLIETFVVDLGTAHITSHGAARNRSDPDFPGLVLYDTTVTTQVTDRAGP